MGTHAEMAESTNDHPATPRSGGAPEISLMRMGEYTFSANQSQRDQLWSLTRTIEGKVAGRHGLSEDFEKALTGAQRAIAERALAAALVRLEGLLAGGESA